VTALKAADMEVQRGAVRANHQLVVGIVDTT